MTCLDKGRERYQAEIEAERHSKPRAEVRRWPRYFLDDSAAPPSRWPDLAAPWRVKFWHRGEAEPRFRRFDTFTEAIEFADRSWFL